jgi:cell division protein ZapA
VSELSENSESVVTVSILDKSYQFKGGRQERESLIASANYLDQKMREIRAAQKVIGTDRIAVMAALNIAHDFLLCHAGIDAKTATAGGKITEIKFKVENAIKRNRQLEIL